MKVNWLLGGAANGPSFCLFLTFVIHSTTQAPTLFPDFSPRSPAPSPAFPIFALSGSSAAREAASSLFFRHGERSNLAILARPL